MLNTTPPGRRVATRKSNLIPFPKKPRVIEADRTKYPDTFGRVLSMHLVQNSIDADNAHIPFRMLKRNLPIGLILVGLAVAAAVAYPML